MAINTRAVRTVVQLLSGAGPQVTVQEAEECVRILHEQAGRALPPIAEVTELDKAAQQAAQCDVLVVDRPQWAVAASQSIATMAAAARALPDGPDEFPLRTPEIAATLAVVAPLVLGQMDPFALGGRLMLVAPNIDKFRRDYHLDAADCAAWVCVHEFTHGVQFAQAPWLRTEIVRYVAQLMTLEEDDADGQDDAVEAALHGVTALMSVLEGHAEYVMNRVPLSVVPSREAVVGAMSKRRRPRSKLRAWIAALTGLNLKAQQYKDGEQFVDAVVQARSMADFNAIWDGPENLPTHDELLHPEQWMERVY